ncbi:MAG: helix-turn-helix domain-containing protein [Parvularculaceae bacterium]
MSQTSQTSTQEKPFAIHERWGDLSEVGFTAVPNTLIHAQARLNLSANQVVILLNLLMHWWRPNSNPFPRSHSIAKRTGMGIRTIQRELRALEQANLIKKVKRGDSTQYEMQGLKAALDDLNSEYAWRNLSKINGQRDAKAEIPF